MNDYMKLMFKTMLKTRGWWLNFIAIAFALLDIAMVLIIGHASLSTSICGWFCTAMWAFNAWILEARIKIRDDNSEK